MVVEAGMVPTEGAELVSGTVTVVPPRTCCTSAKSRPAVSRIAVMVIGVLLTPVGTEKVETLLPPGPAMRKPDGVSVTVPVPLVQPAALAVTVADPVSAMPWAKMPVTVVLPSPTITALPPVREEAPVSPGRPASRTAAPLLLVKLTVRPPTGAGVVSVSVNCACRPLPTVRFERSSVFGAATAVLVSEKLAVVEAPELATTA